MKAFTLTLVLTVVYYVSSNLVYEHLCIKQNGEFLRHPLDCHKFIRCSHGKAYEFQCPANLLWHHEIKTCDYAYRTRCLNGEMFTKKTINNDLSLENKFKKTRKKFKKIGNKNKETFASKRPNKSVTKSDVQWNVKNATQIMLTTTNVKLTKAKNESHNFKNIFNRKLTTFSTHSWQPQQLITKSLNHNLTAMHNVKTTEQLKEMLTESLTTKSSKSETTSINFSDTNLTVNSTVKITELEQETSQFNNINAVTEEMPTKEILTNIMLTESSFKENQYTEKAFIEYISNYLHRASTSVMPTVTTQLENGQIKSSTENPKDENNAKQNYSLNSYNITELPNYQSTSMAKASDATITEENVTVNYNFNKSTEKLTEDLGNGVTTGNLEKTKDKLKTKVANLYQTTKSFNSLETIIQPFTVNRAEEVHPLLETLENYILNKNTTTKYSEDISGSLTKNTATIQESSTIINSSTFKITEEEYNLQNSTDNNSTTILDLESYSNIKLISESFNNTDSFEKTKTTEYSEDTSTTIAESSAILTGQENNLHNLSKSFTENFKDETTTDNFIYETLMEHFIYETSTESFKDETSTESFKNETSTLTTPTESSTEIEDNIKHNFITFKFIPVATVSYTEIHNSSNNLTENFSVNKTEEAKGIEKSPIESSTETPNSLIFKKTNFKQNLSETFKASTDSSAIVSETLVLIEKLNSTTILEEAFTKSTVSSFAIFDNSNNKQNLKYTPNEVTENENNLVNTTEISIANGTISTKEDSPLILAENFNFKVTESINHSPGALENFSKFQSSANNKITTENFNKMPVSKSSLDNFSESSTEIVEFQSSTGQENKISTESFKDIRGSTVLDNEISTESFKDIPDSTFGLTLAIEDFSESLTILSETFNSSVIPTGSFENKITNIKMSTLSEKTLPVTASSLSVTAVSSLEPLTVTTETVNNYEILTEMFDIKTTESNQDLEDSSVLHNEISTKAFNDIPIATFSLDVSKADFLENLTVPRETVNNSETLIENFNDKTTKSSNDSKVPEQNTLHFQGSEAFNDIPDATLGLSSLAETITFNLTDKGIKITSSDLENLENHTETPIITYNDSEETEQDLEKTAGYGDTTFVANTITKYPESLNLKEALSEIMLEDSFQTATDDSFSINFLHTIKDSSRKTTEMENIITNNLESNSTYVRESLDYLEHNGPNNTNLGSTLQPYVTDENDYKASPTVYAVNITEFNNTTASAVNFTENVNLVNSTEEFVTKLITTELLQNSSNILYLTENSIGVFNTNISANLREQERDFNVTDIKRERYSVAETLIAGYNENKLPFKLAENSTDTTVIDFRNISTITTTLQDLTTEFNAHSTTPDPRLPFRSPQCKGVNNRRQFKAPKCFQYYQCFAGWAFLLNCHEGWWFEVKERQCVLDVNKKCELY